MNMRGKWAERPPNALTVNVTSAQTKTSRFRIDFSPMTLKTYEGFACFENFWQAGKVFEGIPHEQSIEWWKKQTKGKRRYPKGKGKKVLHADFGYGKQLYIQARKNTYIPRYNALIENTESLRKLKNLDKDICICDFDGPRTTDGKPTCLEVTEEMLQQKLHDETFPFGHGYIVAAAICGFTLV